jgi:transposase
LPPATTQFWLRSGAGKATVAVEFAVLVAAHHMLDRGQPFQGLGADCFQRRRSPQHADH